MEYMDSLYTVRFVKGMEYLKPYCIYVHILVKMAANVIFFNDIELNLFKLCSNLQFKDIYFSGRIQSAWRYKVM
jgi:hypothetical protein